MNKNLDRRIHPIAEADGLSPKKLVKVVTRIELYAYTTMSNIIKSVKLTICHQGTTCKENQ